MAKISLEHIYKRYDNEKIVVDDLNLEIKDNEFLVIVGPSGCGKTTTLRMIGGLEEITAGSLRFGENEVNALQPKDRNVAMVFQNYALYPHLNVKGNLAFGLKIQREPKDEIEKKVQEIAEILEITEYLSRKPKELSGGQRQRVAMGRALIRQTEVLLMDEPLSNLDAKLRVQMRSEILALHKRIERTVVYVTHDQVEAMTMGDRIAVMSEGVLQQVASPMEVFQKPANLFVAGFIGTPRMNFLDCEIVQKEGRYLAQNEMLSVDVTSIIPKDTLQAQLGRPTVLGIRPDSIEPLSEEAQAQKSLVLNVKLVENMGASRIVHAYCNDEKLMIKTKKQMSIAHGDELPVRFSQTAISLFDKQTENNLLNNSAV